MTMKITRRMTIAAAAIAASTTLTPGTAHAGSGQSLNVPFINGRSDLPRTFTAGS
ncbi:hypothetical protein J5X84_35455 [Streptosporangiaceae bacterium NEAU-GS5]|nr:hypothetical protein [Streptosporangiaceae bacterium NEAU-GS5]